VTENHSFVADLTICSNCHGGPGQVDGVALQAQVENEMVALDQLLFAKIADALRAVAAGGTYTVSAAQDTSTGDYLCQAGGAAPSFAFSAAPSAITEPQPPAHWRALTTLWMSFPSLAGANECTASGSVTTTTYGGVAPVSLNLGSVRAGSPPAPVFAPGSIVAKSIWNEALLHDDQTWGVHNLPFTLSVIESTMSQLETLP
jgi:hypothetical protein